MNYSAKQRNCDCGTCCDMHGHQSYCMSVQKTRAASEPDIAEEIAQEDGYMHRVRSVTAAQG